MQKDKIIIKGELDILTGLHIGGSSDFSPIGAVDSPVIYNQLTNQPIIPGSSLKGKMRSLLANYNYKGTGYCDIKNDDEIVKRLFGASVSDSKGDNAKDSKKGTIIARLQFFDLEFTDETVDILSKADLDLPYTEIKFENTINRVSGVANPRQLERVVAGSKFKFKLVYNVENHDEISEDFENIQKAFKLLENDYLGGSGTRGYGRVKIVISDINTLFNNVKEEELVNIKAMLKELE